MMELVIKIDENVFTRLFDNGTEDYAIANDDLFTMAKAIRKGTPLPKEHGRLIDADKFHEVIENIPIKDTDKWFNWMQKTCNRLADAPTIIEGSDTE